MAGNKGRQNRVQGGKEQRSQEGERRGGALRVTLYGQNFKTNIRALPPLFLCRDPDRGAIQLIPLHTTVEQAGAEGKQVPRVPEYFIKAVFLHGK
jgi:hypothetical protein